VLAKGDPVEAMILEVDSGNRRISLGLKQAQEDPWEKISVKYTVGKKVKGVVTKIASFGAFIELEEGVDGLVHISELSPDHVDKVRDILEVGQTVEARVVRLDRSDRRIGLSIRAASMSDEEFEQSQEAISEGLKPGEHMVDLAGAFDQAMGLKGDESIVEEWRPGQKSQDEGSDGDK